MTESSKHSSKWNYQNIKLKEEEKELKATFELVGNTKNDVSETCIFSYLSWWLLSVHFDNALCFCHFFPEENEHLKQLKKNTFC